MTDNGKYKADVDYSGGRFHVRIKTVAGSALMWSGWIRAQHEVQDLMVEWGIPAGRVNK